MAAAALIILKPIRIRNTGSAMKMGLWLSRPPGYMRWRLRTRFAQMMLR